MKRKVDNPLDAADAEDAGPGEKTVVPERAPRKTRTAWVEKPPETRGGNIPPDIAQSNLSYKDPDLYTVVRHFAFE